MEHENGRFSDIWNDESNKLLDTKAPIKVLIYYDTNNWEGQFNKIEIRFQSYPLLSDKEELLVINGGYETDPMIYQARTITLIGTESKTLAI